MSNVDCHFLPLHLKRKILKLRLEYLYMRYFHTNINEKKTFREYFYIFPILLLAMLTFSILLSTPISASPAVEDDVKQFLPSLDYPWLLPTGNEGSTRSSPSPTPCRPQVAYESEMPTSQIVLVEDGVIFSFDPDGRSGDAYALNETTGRMLWRADIHSSLYRFITRNALGKYYYVGTSGSEDKPSLLIALDKMTGRIVWAIEMDERGVSTLIAYNDRICVGTRGGLVSCVDENGNALWRRVLENKVVTDLAYGNGRLYVNLEWSKTLFALSAESGEPVWTFDGDDYLSGVAFKNNMILVQEYNRKLIALSPNGTVIWKKEIGVQSFSVGEDAIYVIDYRKLSVLDFQGREIGRFDLPEGERFEKSYGLAVAAKRVLALPVYGKNYGRLYLLWRGITPIFNLTYPGEGATSPRVSIAYGRIYAVFYTYDRILIYKLHDAEKPVVVSAEAASEVYEGEELLVKAKVYDDRSGIYRVLLAYSIDGGKWNYVDMELERRYVTEPVCGYGYSEEPYVGRIPAQRAGSRISWRVIAIDNVGNYLLSQERTCLVIEKRDVNPPVTRAVYEDKWYREDLTITLEAEDDLSGVAETYYRVNNGPLKRVSVDGHPLISVEGANNTLEYWSVDKAGNEEAHKFITGIKLDKSRPTANAGQDRKVNVGETVAFDASASADNIGIASYEWDFGDGEKGTGVKVAHTYNKAGAYTVTLTVKDWAGNIGTHSVVVTVTEAFPTPITIAAIILAAVIAIVAILAVRRRHS
ncbi:MAG: PKD domain-containing protein [Thermofilaceae archaeon]